DLPKIETDEAKLYQVLQNVISNAVKFTEKGNVDIHVKMAEKNVIIEVKDTGIGIPEMSLPHIFEEFLQVDGSSSRQFEGTGLGLAIAHKMIRVLGGDIEVKSQLDKGSTFTITIPVKWYQEAMEPMDQASKPLLSQLEKETILVVDDDPEFVRLISECINAAGFRTIGANSGSEALKLAEELLPFAITLDVIMPEMDGWEVLQKLKIQEKTKNIPVIIVSVTDDRETGIALGAMGYVSKPIDKSLLISEIYKLHNAPVSIMIADDNEFDLNRMSEIIEAEKINTILAKGGKECIELLKDNIPNILVLDLMMPDVDGFQVLKTIRDQPETQNLPVIIVTAKDLTEEDKELFKGSVSSIVAKSETTPLELFTEIKRILAELENLKKTYSTDKRISGTRILVVEDNPDTVVQLEAVLKDGNYIIDVASNGQEALDYIQHTIPDGIILDLMMPDIDGFEVLEKIRSTEKTKNIPVLVLTAKDLSREDLSKLSANNIQQLIHKGDVDIDGLLFKVKLMLGNEPNSSTKNILSGGVKEEGKTGFEENPINNDEKKETENIKGNDRPDKKDLLNVLIVEDNPDNMTTIKAILKGRFNILEAVDGEQGFMIAKSQFPDLILLDISLPRMSGLEMVKLIRGDNSTNKIPVIAVTAHAMQREKEKFIEAGCDGYVPKPIDQEMLLAEIERLVQKIV
ncbi:MAG: response regulator, partial [SAR324 cluster bacterium]|nr:response regulator [SAR324 cluster bacterium]